MKKILIVEDRADFRLLLKRILKRGNFNVVTASNGKEALKVFHEESPDMALLDINLPDTTGYDICKKIRADKDRGRVPIIFITVKSSPDYVINGMKAGGDDYIFKPFLAEEVLARIAALFRRAATD